METIESIGLLPGRVGEIVCPCCGITISLTRDYRGRIFGVPSVFLGKFKNGDREEIMQIVKKISEVKLSNEEAGKNSAEKK